MTIIGARPQFVKAAPVSRAFERVGIREILVHSGQHYDEAMSGSFFRQLGIAAPACNLGIGSSSHAEQTGRMMIALEQFIGERKPDWVLVYGDTNTTLAGALAAAKLGVRIAHVEAGLRSGNMLMPEEINRIATDRISSLLFTPTQGATETLAHEGVSSDKIVQSGDVMFDAALLFGGEVDAEGAGAAAPGVGGERFILATIHRAENTDDPNRLRAILDGMGQAGLPIFLPLHPRTRKAIEDAGIDVPSSITLGEPVGYFDMLRLLKTAAVVVTDSGGVQKEAYFFRKPCVTVRTETEWPELVSAGWNRLARPDSSQEVQRAIQDALNAALPAAAPDFYGNGNASMRIAQALYSA